MVFLLLLALLDVVAGSLILILQNPLFPMIAKYVGMILLVKGIWSLIVGWRSF